MSKAIAELALHVGSDPAVKDIDGVVAVLQKDIPEINRTEIVRAINEATASDAKARTELSKKLSDLKREAKNDARVRAAAADLERRIKAGEGPPSPKPKRPAPEAIRALRVERNKLRAELDKIASAPAERARVKARIAELDKFIAEGKVPPRKPKPATPADLAALRAERDAKYRQAQQADPARRAELNQQIAVLEGHLKAGTVPEKAAPAKPAPADIAALRKKRDELRAQVGQADPAIRQRIRDQIAEIEANIKAGTVPPKATPKTPPPDVAALREQRAKLTAQMKAADPAKRQALRDQIAALEQNIREGSRPVKPAPTAEPPADLAAMRAERDRLKQRMDQEDAARARIAELEQHLRDGTLPAPADAPTPEVAPEVAELREAADALQKALATSEPALRKKYEGQIAALTDKLEDGVYTPPVPAEAIPESRELQQLMYRRDLLRRRVRNQIQALKPRGWFRTATSPVVGTLNAARAVMTSMDFSAVLRQGGFIALGHPRRAARALGPMFRAFASKEASHAINTAILERENAPLYLRSKLYVAPDEATEGSLSKQEEAFMSRLVEHIPLVAGSQRAYVTFLNVLRADSFDAMVATLGRNGEVTQQEADAIANYVNVATGRGTLGKLEGAAVGLNTIFFAPRYVASRFQIIAGQPFYGGNERTRKLIAQEYGRLLAGLGVVMALGWLAGAEFEDDPTSSDFLKLRFGGTRIDPMMGLAQVTTLTSRLGKGIYQTATGQQREKNERGTGEVAFRFLRSKLAPVPGALLNIAAGENMVGEPVTLASSGLDLVTPISFSEVGEVMQEQGVEKGTAFALLNMFGMGLQHYEEKPEPRRRVARSGRDGR